MILQKTAPFHLYNPDIRSIVKVDWEIQVSRFVVRLTAHELREPSCDQGHAISP